MKRLYIGIMVVISIFLLAGCFAKPVGGGTGEESVFDKTIDKQIALDNEANGIIPRIEGMRINNDMLEIVVEVDKKKDYYKVPLLKGQIDLNNLQKIDSWVPILEEEKKSIAISGYLKGTYHIENISESISSIVFEDDILKKHIDLLEINHKKEEKISNVRIANDFKLIYYEIVSSKRRDSIIHDLATNTHQIIAKKDMDILLSDSGKIIVVKHDIKDNIINIINILDLIDVQPAEIDENIYDVVIKNGIVTDPNTNTYKFGYDIGIKGDTIEQISDTDLIGNKTIDATGLIVSPGFIDMLGVNLSDTIAKYKITDGVTTNLSLHGCTADFKTFFRGYEKYPTYINYGGAIFAVKIRYERGLGAYGTPTEEDIVYMADRVREEIEAGGIALAFSPEYYPGTNSEEIRAMMEVAVEYDIPIHFHGRYSAVVGEYTGIDGVKEVIEYAKELNARVQFMHLHSTGGTGMIDEALDLINKARERGYDITYDVYPYDSWASEISGKRYEAGWQERYDITYNDLQMAGTKDKLTRKTFDEYREEGGLCIAYALNEDEMIQALSEPYAMVGSDGNIDEENSAKNHYRGAGTFSRVLGKYVREENSFSLMEGLRKMTINSAKHLEEISEDMAKRGRLEEGCIADITIFDYKTIADKSTAEAPATTSTGIHYVLVSGTISLDETGLIKSVRAGQAIKSDFLEID